MNSDGGISDKRITAEALRRRENLSEMFNRRDEKRAVDTAYERQKNP
jgi:hypothetical protein